VLETLEGMPEGVVGIRATGRVTGDDYRTVFVSALDRALEQGGKARLLYELGGDYEGYDAGGLWQDLRLGATHFTSFERIALIPGEVRLFGLADRDAAVDWVAG
jgi:SpoIIAA-like